MKHQQIADKYVRRTEGIYNEILKAEKALIYQILWEACNLTERSRGYMEQLKTGLLTPIFNVKCKVHL